MVHMIYGFRVKEGLFQFVLMITFIALLCLFSTSRYWQIYFTFISHLPHKFYTDFSEKLLRACTCDFTISCVTLNMEKTDVPRAYLHKEHLFLRSYSPPDSETETVEHCYGKRNAGKSFIPSGELRADVKSLAAYVL